MNQSSIIAAALIIGFIVYITVRGQLTQYLGILGIGSAAVNPVTTLTPATNTSGTAASGINMLSTGLYAPIPATSPSLASTTIGNQQPLPIAPVVPSPNAPITLNDGTVLTI